MDRNKYELPKEREEIIKSFQEDIIQALGYEMAIEKKKLDGIPLTKEEKFFDTYFVKPSTLIKAILERGK